MRGVSHWERNQEPAFALSPQPSVADEAENWSQDPKEPNAPRCGAAWLERYERNGRELGGGMDAMDAWLAACFIRGSRGAQPSPTHGRDSMEGLPRRPRRERILLLWNTFGLGSGHSSLLAL
jgi:hypothetical protein